MNDDGKVELSFTHPKDSGRVFVAQVAPVCEAGEALANLQAVAFLEPEDPARPYSLVHDGALLPATMPLGQVGVTDGAVLGVTQAAQGASPWWALQDRRRLGGDCILRLGGGS